MTAIADRAREIIAEHLCRDLEEVTDDKTLITDLGGDSLDIVELHMAFEDEWNITLREAEVNSLETVGDAIRLVEERVAASATA